MLLLVFYGLCSGVLVGTDVVHALLLTASHGPAADEARQCGLSASRVRPDWFDSRRRDWGLHRESHPVEAVEADSFCGLITFGTRMFWEGIVHGQ